MPPGYRTFAVQLLATIVAALIPVFADDIVTSSEIINVIIIALGAVGVLGAGNFPAGVWKYTEVYVSAATVVATLFASLFVDGIITTSEIFQLIVAGLGALGVVAVPSTTVARVDPPCHAAAE